MKNHVDKIDTIKVLKGRPKDILFFGNGVVDSHNGYCNSDETDLIRLLSEDFGGKYISDCSNGEKGSSISFIYRALIASNNQFSKKKNSFFKGVDLLNGAPLFPSVRDLIEKRGRIVITTNYTYFSENNNKIDRRALPFSKYRKKKKKAKSKNPCRVDPQQSVRNYNVLKNKGGDSAVFHIHGEMKKPGSLIFDFDSYGRYLLRVVDEANGFDKERYWRKDEVEKIQYSSWIDYFLDHDVNIHIVGFGLDLGELDIWWLIAHKAKDKDGTGKIYWYSPYWEEQKTSNQRCLIEAINKTTNKELIEVVDFNGKIEGENYAKFYEAVCDFIETKEKEHEKGI